MWYDDYYDYRCEECGEGYHTEEKARHCALSCRIKELEKKVKKLEDLHKNHNLDEE